MKLYKGILIHRRHQGEQTFDVVDDGPFRSLHFNSLSIQSRMQRSEPERLVLEYTRAMMLALAFQPQPKRALLIGLGGGSQARFLLKHFPDCRCDAVEIEPAITELARRFFCLPESEHLAIHHMDTEAFLAQDPSQDPYDLVLIDAFDQSGPVESIFNTRLLQALRQRMSDTGVCAINTWRTGADKYHRLWQSISEAFRAPAYDLELTEDPENLILFFPMQAVEGKTLLRNGKMVEKQTALKLLKLLPKLAFLSNR